MRQDLDALCTEFEQEAATRGLIVFHSYSRGFDEGKSLYWDVERHPDLRSFLDVALSLGVRLVVYHHRRMDAEMIDDAFERLEAIDVPHEERREIESDLKRLRMYEGFTCSFEVSFDYEGRCYLYDVRTEWYEELLDTLDTIHDYMLPDDEDEEGPVSGGYFSRN